MFPEQRFFTTMGYLVFLIAPFLIMFITILCSNRFGKEKTNVSIWTNIFISLCISCITIFAHDDTFGVTTYFPPLLTKYASPIASTLFFSTLLYGFFLFLFTFGWAYYKFHSKGEITDFMWRIIRFAEDVKQDMRL